MHWSANGVTNWTADRAVVCRCIVWGHRPCHGSVRVVVYVHAWAGGPSCWVRVRFWLFQLGGFTSWFFGARGVRQRSGGAAGVRLLGPVARASPRPRAACCCLAGLRILWPRRLVWGGHCGRAGRGLCLVLLAFWCPCVGGGVGGGFAPSKVSWTPPLGLCYVVCRLELTFSVSRAALLRYFVPGALFPPLSG